MTILKNNLPGWGAQWPAPAKLNLLLKIVARRNDGYHLLQTVFQLIDLCDWLIFHPVNDGQVCLQRPVPGVSEQEDLTVRAANLLKSETGFQGGVCIENEKNLPMGGGLGGGSSDAATTLVVLNKLWGLELSVQRLMELGVSLGADVPVFVFGYNAWAEGVGETLKKISIPESWFVIIKPACHVGTKEIFCTQELTRDSKPITIADFYSGSCENDCLEVVKKLYQPVADALQRLSKFGKARLTGTGACVFVQFDNEAIAKRTFGALQQEGREVYLAKGMDVSPLQKQLSEVWI